MQRERQLDGAEVGAEVAAGLGDRLHDEVADLAGQVVELGVAQGPQVCGPTDLVQRHDGHERYCSSRAGRVFRCNPRCQAAQDVA